MAKHRAPTIDTQRPAEMKILAPASDYDIKEEFITRDDEIGLGRMAVLASMYDTESAIENGDKSGLKDRLLGLLYKEAPYLKPKDIEEIRQQIETLRADAARHLYDETKGTFIGAALFGDESDTNFYDWKENPLGARLREKDGKGKYTVSDETIVNFAEWYMGQTLDRQKKLDVEIKQLRHEYKSRVYAAIETMGLPLNALTNISGIDSIDVLQDDMFVTEKHGTHGALGLYWNRGPIKDARIMLSPREKLASRDDVLTHEWTHALSNDPEAYYGRDAVLARFFGNRGSLIINEALTEHLSQSLIDGDLDTIRPSARKREGMYVLYREFLDLLVNGGGVKIDIREVYNLLYFSQQDDMRQIENSDKVHRLFANLNNAFGGIDICACIMSVRSDADLEKLMAHLSGVHSRHLVTSENVVATKRDKDLVAAAQKWGGEFDEK